MIDMWAGPEVRTVIHQIGLSALAKPRLQDMDPLLTGRRIRK